MNHSITVTLLSDDGEEEEFKLPATKEVCHDCDGHGKVLHEAIRNHAYTPEEFNESFDDEEREQYFKRGGMYDVTCPTCKGSNVTDEIDEEACKRDPALAAIYERLEEKWADDAAAREEEAHWARMEY